MLVLTRKSGEKINIGDDIVLTVIGVDRNKIRIGIEAPKSVFICRQEIVQTDLKEKFKAKSNQEVSDSVSVL